MNNPKPPLQASGEPLLTNDLRDTADEIDAAAADPTPAEITDPAHGDFVTPYPEATPIGGQS